MNVLRGTGHPGGAPQRVEPGLGPDTEPAVAAVLGFELHFQIDGTYACNGVFIGLAAHVYKIRVHDGEVAVARRRQFSVAVAQDDVIAWRPPLRVLAHVGPIPQTVVPPLNGQIQAQGHFGQFSLCLYPLGDVGPERNVLLHKPIVTNKGRDHGVHPIHLTVLCTIADFTAPGSSRRYGFPHCIPKALGVVAGIHNPVVLPNQFFTRIATDTLKRFIAVGNGAIAIGLGNYRVDVNGGGQRAGLLQGRFQFQLRGFGRLHRNVVCSDHGQVAFGTHCLSGFQRLRCGHTQMLQYLPLHGVEFFGRAIDHAQRAYSGTVGQRNGGPSVKADVGRSLHQWTAGKTRILKRIFHFKHLIAQYGVRAECNVSGRLGGAQPHIRFEPLPVCVHQADE